MAIYGASIAFAFTFGLTSPLLSLILESRGVNSTLIGLNGSMTAIGFLVSAPFIPRVIQRYGAMRFMAGSVLIATTAVLLLRVIDDLGAWFVLRFAFGVAVNVSC